MERLSLHRVMQTFSPAIGTSMPATAWLQVIMTDLAWGNRLGRSNLCRFSTQVEPLAKGMKAPEKSEVQNTFGISWGQEVLEAETCENPDSEVMKCWAMLGFRCFWADAPYERNVREEIRSWKYLTSKVPWSLKQPCDQVSFFRSTTKMWPPKRYFCPQLKAASQAAVGTFLIFFCRDVGFKWDNPSRLRL